MTELAVTARTRTVYPRQPPADRWLAGDIVAAIDKLTYRQLDNWIRIGWVTTALPAQGSGTIRLFSFDDALRAAVLAEVSPWATRIVADAMRGLTPDDNLVRVATSDVVTVTIDVRPIRHHLRQRLRQHSDEVAAG